MEHADNNLLAYAQAAATRRGFVKGAALGAAALAALGVPAAAFAEGQDAQEPAAQDAAAQEGDAQAAQAAQDAPEVGVCAEETELPYYKYYAQDMAEIPEEKIAVRDGGPSELKAVPFDQKDLYLAGQDDDFCQVGYGIMDDGTGFVCNTTYMPGVTPEMLDWWFPWHSVGSDLRYKMWDREDHYFARADNVPYVCDPDVPMNQKTWGVNHYIIENIGLGPEFLKLQFLRPADFGYDESVIGSDACASMVCAVGDSTVAAAMTHKWYPYEDGVMFCSRFWIGMGIVDGKVVKTLPEGQSVPDIVPKCLFGHNIKEFANLAAILPSVYEENKDSL